MDQADEAAMIQQQARYLSPVYQLLYEAAMRHRARQAGPLVGDYKPPTAGPLPTPEVERPTA